MSWFAAPREAPAMNPASKVGLMALEIATREIGLGEVGGNNAGENVARYKSTLLMVKGEPVRYTPRLDQGAWCASFASYCIARACAGHLRAATLLGVSLAEWHANRHGAKALFKMVRKAGYAVTVPQPGDLYCLHRGKDGDWRGHIGIVESLVGGGVFMGLEGNKGGTPALVEDFKHVVGEPGMVGIARLPLEFPAEFVA